MVEAHEGLPATKETILSREKEIRRIKDELARKGKELVKGPPEASKPNVREEEKLRVQEMTRRDFLVWAAAVVGGGIGAYLGFFKRDLLGRIMSVPKEAVDTISPRRESRGELGGQWVEQAEIRRLYLLESQQGIKDTAAYITREAAVGNININDKSTWSKELVEYFAGVDKFYQDLQIKEGRDRLRTLSEKWAASPQGSIPDRRDELQAFEDFLVLEGKDKPFLDILHSYLKEKKEYGDEDIEMLDTILLPEKRTNLKETLNTYNTKNNKDVPQLK